jgi:hypothetical protein
MPARAHAIDALRAHAPAENPGNVGPSGIGTLPRARACVQSAA